VSRAKRPCFAYYLPRTTITIFPDFALTLRASPLEHRGRRRSLEGSYARVRSYTPLRCGRNAALAQQPLDRGAADPIPELAHLALDPNITPGQVLDGEPTDQIGEFAVHAGSTAAIRVRLFPDDQSAMPGQRSPRSQPP